MWEFTFEAHLEEHRRDLVRCQAGKQDLAVGQCQSNRPRVMETCSLLIWGWIHTYKWTGRTHDTVILHIKEQLSLDPALLRQLHDIPHHCQSFCSSLIQLHGTRRVCRLIELNTAQLELCKSAQ